MCGLAGFLQSRNFAPESAADNARAMVARIAHRGPDDSGIWTDLDAGVAIAHCRLSVVDLSPAGCQPMMSRSGRFVFVFNGEIYNHSELRRLLGTYDWRGHSDTEVLLACFAAWGVNGTLKKAVGMFAFALWDRAEQSLTLGRDRIGEKPLYYGWQGDAFLFGSELKALKAHPSFRGEINRDVVPLLLRHSYIPAPYSIFRGIRKLLPGTVIRLKRSQLGWIAGEIPEPTPYWSFNSIVHNLTRRSFVGSETEAISAVETCLKEAVGLQMVADVPLGAFLSGGIDSSTIVALMQAQSTRPVKTFTVGFHEARHNEAEYAKAVAQHLGTDHTELYVTPEEARAVIPSLSVFYDEPFSDSSQIPTFLVSKMARQQVTVSLSGDAGDELFGGYNRYIWASRMWRTLKWFPQPIRHLSAAALTKLSPERWNKIYGGIVAWLPERYRTVQPGDKAYKLAELFSTKDPQDIYHRLVSHWKEPMQVALGAVEPDTRLGPCVESSMEFDHWMMYLDTLTYLPDDILVKVDRAAMAVSLETRVPFLDHRVVELAWQLPLSMKIRNGKGKWILRQVLNKYVPNSLVDRPKMGFGVPIDTWLRGPLRDWAEALLNEGRLRKEGFFNTQPIRQKWLEHLSGQRNWQYHLWDILMFQAWLAKEQSH
jgi:asparagine synthase (glutamine-hydrolysing)